MMGFYGSDAKPDEKDKRWNPRGFKLPEFREKIVTFPIFSNYTMVIVVTEEKSLMPTVSYISDRDFNREPDLSPTCDACTMRARHGHTYIMFTKDATLGTIAHEAWHAIYHMLKDFAGAELEDETVAYHLGYLVDQISQFIHEDEEKVNVDSGSSHSTRVPRRARRRRVAKRAQKKS